MELYGFVPWVQSTTTVRGFEAEADLAPGQILNLLQFAASARASVERERLGLLVDLPNGKFFGDTIINYSSHAYRRDELEAQLDHSADVQRAITLLRQALQAVPNQHPGLPADEEILSFNERGPRLAVRPYTRTDHYWQVYFDSNRVIAETLSGHGFPTPRLPIAMETAPTR
ncbi:MAG: mechanosensitive ion channel family protein [Vulcanococcus sp.]